MQHLCSAGWDFEIDQWAMEANIIGDQTRTIGAIARDLGLLPDCRHPQFGTYLCESAGEQIIRTLELNARDLLNLSVDELAALVERFAKMAV